MKSNVVLSLLLAFLFPTTQYSQNKFFNSTVSLDGDLGGLIVNSLAAIINSNIDDNDCYEYGYYDESSCNRVNGIRMHFGGEFKLNFNLHQQFSLSGGYRILSMPFDRYGDEIISQGFYVEPQINLSDDFEDTAFVFAQFGKTSFNNENIVPHWQYTLGLGYKVEAISFDLGYNFFNKPLEQQTEFNLVEDRLFRTEDSFLNKGFAMVRVSANIF